MRALLTVLMLTFVQAQNKCGFELNVFSDNTCSTPKTNMGGLYGSDGTVTVPGVNIGKCYTGANANIKIESCNQEKNYLIYSQYSDESCSSLVNDQPAILGLVEGDCTIVASDAWVKIQNIDLTGNKFGIGWAEGWGIFLCQTVLLGVCAGY